MSEVFKLGNDISNKVFFSSNIIYILEKHYNSELNVYVDYQNNRMLDEELAVPRRN
jgi:hypothetical protein